MLIVFEGIDGAGKGGQIRRFLSFLRQKGLGYKLHKYPTRKAKSAKSHLSGKKTIAPMELASAFAEDIMAEQEKIAQEMSEGKVAVCDRYLHSTLAYQGVEGDYAKLKRMLNSHGAIQPDLVVLLDLDENTSYMRKSAQKEPDRFESDIAYLGKVRKNYHRILKEEFLGYKFEMIDASGSKGAVFSRIVSAAEPMLAKRMESKNRRAPASFIG